MTTGTPGDLSARAQRFAATLTDWPRKRLQLTELWRVLDQADPATRLAPDRRTILLTTLTEIADHGLLQLPAAQSWDRIEQPHLPRFVTLPAEDANTSHTRRDTIWHPALAWVPDTRLPATHRTDLDKINRWLHTNRNPLVVPLRERSLEIFGHEKTLDRLLRTSLFAPDRLTLELLLTRRASPRFTHETVGPGTTLLAIENSDTFDSLTHALTETPGRVGIVGWGSGGGFEASVLSIPRLTQPVDRILYFGDLDLRGLQIPASASRTAQAERLPAVEPATYLYEALLEMGQPQTGKRVSDSTADTAVEWLPEHLRIPAHRLLTSGKRLAQEHIGAAYLATHAGWQTAL